MAFFHIRSSGLTRAALAAWALAATSLLVACGGGSSGSAATATTTNTATSAATTSGTVTGFGSVFVDGVELEDALASTRVENADGSYTNVALKLGQRISVAHDSSGTASSITVAAALVGAVSSLDTAANAFKVAGQWVSVNSDATAGAVTVYGGGYTALADLVAGDLAEVHGSLVYSSTHAAYAIQATRVEKKTTISAVRILGKLASLNTTAKTFSINGVTVQYGSATVVPTGSTLANDQVVAVWGAGGSLTGGSSPTLAATRLRVLSSTTASTVASGTAQVGGVASGYSASANTFTIDGVVVSLASATVTPTGSTVADGAYVQVKGTFDSAGVLVATTVSVRQQSTTSATATVRLKGAISSFVDASSFVVRGLPVDASAIVLATACPGVTLANGVVVDLTAAQQTGTDVLKASSMRCVAASTYTMRDLRGTAGTVDSSAKTFVLTLASSTAQNVLWTDATAWGTGVASATLSGASVEVEGYLNSASVLVARSVRLQGTDDADRYGTASGWSSYNSSHPRTH